MLKVNKIKHKKLVVILSSIAVAIAVSSCNSNAGKSSGAFGLMGQTGHAANVTSQSWSYTYNNQDLIETATDPNGNVTRYDYDAEGRLTKVTNALKQTISFANFEKHVNPQTIIDQNGVTTKLTYTNQGWLHTSTIDGALTTFDYDEVGNITKVTLADKTSLSYVYDGANYLMEIDSADGAIKYTRDNAGNITGTTISGSSVVYSDQRVYDEINRLLKITTDTSTQSFSYDNDNNLQTSTDGRNNRTTFNFDELQRLTQVTDARNSPSKYTYDNNKNIEYPNTVTDAKGTKTLYEYNGISNLLKLTSPDSGNHNYTAYDGNGNLTQQQDARGNTISYDYDALDRPKTITYADSIDNTNFTYDNGSNAVGRLTKVQNGVSSNIYHYDARGNTLSEVQRINDMDYTVRYAYDKADHLTNIVYPSNTQIVYTYTNGQISRVTANGKVVANIKHLPFGPINQVAYNNGVTEDIAYNTDYSIKELKVSNNLLDREYSYYPNGQIKAISGVGEYDYDQLGALTKAESNSYGYDKASNRTTENVNGSKTDYTIEGTSNRLLSSTFNSITSDYKYDTAGNIIKAEDINYSYDNLNRLKSVTQDSKLSDKQLATYQYNSFSQRIMKDVDGNKTIFIYNSVGQLLEEINKAQNATKDYVYADGQLIAIAENGQILYIVADHLNAPQIVMDSSGRSIWSAKYNEFGKATIISNYKLNLRADGQYQDDETGLYYNWHRYYNPDLGRYITSDPIGLAAGMNTYIYVNGNPINYTDQYGLWLTPAARGIAKAAAIGFGIGAGVETTSELVNAGLDPSKLQPSNILIAGAAGALTGGVGGATSGMSAAASIAINTFTGGVAGAGQQMATNACNGSGLYDGVLDSALWGGGLNGGGNAFTSSSRNILKNAATANFTKLEGKTSAKEATVPVVANAGETIGSWTANIGTSITQIYLNFKNSQSNR